MLGSLPAQPGGPEYWTLESAMARGLSSTEFHKLARMGAAARLAELEREMASLRKVFPGLKAASSDASPAAAAPALPARLTARASKRGRKKPMSAAERKAVSERMKRYWADRRKSKN
jgi:hypothetical protein